MTRSQQLAIIAKMRRQESMKNLFVNGKITLKK